MSFQEQSLGTVVEKKGFETIQTMLRDCEIAARDGFEYVGWTLVASTGPVVQSSQKLLTLCFDGIKSRRCAMHFYLMSLPTKTQTY